MSIILGSLAPQKPLTTNGSAPSLLTRKRKLSWHYFEHGFSSPLKLLRRLVPQLSHRQPSYALIIKKMVTVLSQRKRTL